MYTKQDMQTQIDDRIFIENPYDEKHPIYRLSKAINWNALLNHLKGFYSKDKGRPSTPLRAQAGTLIIKHLKNLPDRDTVRMVEENLYAQYFCGLLPSQAKGYMNPATGLTNFRAKIGKKGMAFIMEILNCAAHGKSLKKGDTLILDTTCVPLDIIYPTDIKLLERCRVEIMRLFKKAKKMGLDITYRAYNRTARRTFVYFSKLRKTAKKTRKRVHKRIFQFVKRNLKQLLDMKDKATRQLGKQYNVDTDIMAFLKSIKETENKVRVIMHQQSFVRQGEKHIKNRIVSFDKTHTRPIVRGKVPVNTEFGPKILVAVVRNSVHLIEAFSDNVSDSLMIAPALRWFKNKFNRLPKKILGDRGFSAEWRNPFLKKMKIISGIQQRGKKIKDSTESRKMINQRLIIEAMISLGKRKFGLNKCRARIKEYEASWIGLGISALNAHRAFRYSSP